MRIQTNTRKPMRRRLGLLTVALLSAGGLGAAAIAGTGQNNTAAPSAAMARLEATSQAFVEVTERVSPAVVFIQVEKTVMPVAGNGQLPGGLDEEMLKRFFGDKLPELQRPRNQGGSMPRTVGQGSGFIVSDDGYILTNNHVVSDAEKVRVTLSDGRKFDATVVGTDPRSDVAVIRIEADDLPTLEMGSSDDLKVGQWVLAVGSPFGLSGSVTSGIVSAKGRSRVGIVDYENFIQTDAAINPGNSGGPLLNLRGEVIGINTAIASRSGTYNGIGFAIPIDMAGNIYQQIVNNGSVTRGFLGIAIQQLTPELADSFGLAGKQGVLVGDVTANSPARQAGLEAGDVIVEFNGKSVERVGAFRNRVAATEPEVSVPITVLRDGKEIDLSVTLGKLDSEVTLASTTNIAAKSRLGLSVRSLNAQEAEKLGVGSGDGVVIASVDPGSSAAQAGLRPGMVITEVNRQAVTSESDYRDQVDAAEGETVLLRVRDKEMSRFVAVKKSDK